MRRAVRRHPLQSFRFWFLVLSGVALATAWRLDLFGNRRAHQRVAAGSKDLPAPPGDSLDDEDLTLSDELLDDQIEPAPEPAGVRPGGGANPSAKSAVGNSAPPRQESPLSGGTASPSATTDVSPFGPARPEFVAARTPSASNAATPAAAMPPAAGAEEQALRFQRGMAVDQGSSDVPAARFDWPVAGAVNAPTELRRTALVETQSTGSEGSFRNPLRNDSQVVAASNSQSAVNGGDVFQAVGSSSKVEQAVGATSDEQAFAEVDRLIEAGEDIAAHRLLSERYWKEPAARPQLLERLDWLADRIYLQPRPQYIEPRVVQAGDVLQTIAKEYDVPWQYLAKVNRVDPKQIRPDQKLKVIKGPFAVVVDLSRFELTVHCHGYYVKRFDVGIGRDGASPVGTFRVQEKLVDPTYYGPDQVVEHDDPRNPLGEHWIGIGNSFGIHGTIEPDSIGKAESQGCIRLKNEDVAEVYDFLSIGSEVSIRR